MEEKYSYFVLINLPEEDDPYPLFVTTDEAAAYKEADEVRRRWEENGSKKEVWVESHIIENGIMFDYDWLLPEDAIEEDDELNLEENDN